MKDVFSADSLKSFSFSELSNAYCFLCDCHYIELKQDPYNPAENTKRLPNQRIYRVTTGGLQFLETCHHPKIWSLVKSALSVEKLAILLAGGADFAEIMTSLQHL